MDILCRERLFRLESVLERASGRSITLRQLTRIHNILKWEVEQAADLGVVEVYLKKPATGRPSWRVMLREHSKTLSAKLPPPRKEIEKPISCRHFNFALESTHGAVKGGNNFLFRIPCYTQAYLKCFPGARSRHGAASSMSRLLKHPDVMAARAWFYAEIRKQIPPGVKMPRTASGIYRSLDELIGSATAK